MAKLFERRLTPADSPLAIISRTTAAFLAAMLVAAFLFVSYGAHPLQAYFALFHEPFATLRGFGYTLARTPPLVLIGLGAILPWLAAFSYPRFDDCVLLGS